MDTTFRNRAFSLMLLIGFTIPAMGSAAAEEQISSDSVKVSYADLDISSDAGAKALYSRLKRASEQVCGLESYTTVRSLAARRGALDCFHETLEGSVREIGSTALMEVHAS